MRQDNPKLKQDFFNNLPSELVIDILSRLPVGSIICCKCVQKSWLHLIQTEEVVNSHLSKSLPGLLAIDCTTGRILHRFFEFEEQPLAITKEEEYPVDFHKLHYNPATPWFHIPPLRKLDISSANGLLFWKDKIYIYICNPITREYITIPCPGGPRENLGPEPFVTYGFGAAKISGQHKVLRVSRDGRIGRKFEYEVYTLGTGLWRKIDPSYAGLSLHDTDYCPTSIVFLNGSLHWLTTISPPYIFSLDLETELFCTWGSPLPLPVPVTYKSRDVLSLCVVWDGLCLCDASIYGETAVWLVKEDKCWVKEFVIRHNQPSQGYDRSPFSGFKVVKVFKDGDMLVQFWNDLSVTRLQKTDGWNWFRCWHRAIIHTPSLLSLRSFEMENVISF